MEIVFSEFKDLKPEQVEDIFSLRQQVFIIEQNCFYNDIDGEDRKAKHLLIYKENSLAAYLRIFAAGAKFKQQASMGRIVVAPGFRGTEVGTLLIKKGIELCGGAPIRIEAQAELKNYYHRYGFKEKGEVYVVDGINHLQMVLPE